MLGRSQCICNTIETYFGMSCCPCLDIRSLSLCFQLKVKATMVTSQMIMIATVAFIPNEGVAVNLSIAIGAFAAIFISVGSLVDYVWKLIWFPQNPAQREMPLYVIRYTQRVEMMCTPVISITACMLIALMSSSKAKKNLLDMIACGGLLTCCLVLCCVLLVYCHRAKENPTGQPAFQILTVLLYVSGFSGLFISVIAVFLPGISWTSIAAGLFVTGVLVIFEATIQRFIGFVVRLSVGPRAQSFQKSLDCYLEIFHFFVVPLGGFTMTILVYLQFSLDTIKVQAMLIVPLAFLGVAIIIAFALLFTYQRAAEDLSQNALFKLSIWFYIR
ncbi:uncharacterized protein LOC143557220 [Bidens hawaiensis]|uniref:uncharacterized protein LOC143557220 n=1 Tax=Bidens hawaiensis TaxID=980011 RepID=UPI00404A6F67